MPRILKFFIFLIFLFERSQQKHHYEKFFEIQGGPEYMYYFAKFQVGTPQKIQTAIIDTGSDTLAFPCDSCQNRKCADHIDTRFRTKKSTSFNFDMQCNQHIVYKNKQVCQFVKTYAEGSSLLGFLGDDYIRFKNARYVDDKKLSRFNEKLTKDLKLKAEFGCTVKETGLFQDQYADGILGLDDGSTLIKSLEDDNSLKGEKVFSFGLCFHNNGGIMSIDLRHKFLQDDKITMLDKDINKYTNHLVTPYITENNYYEIKMRYFKLAGKVFNNRPISVMIDSGTTFSHFPAIYLENILLNISMYCRKNQHLCGKIPNPNFQPDSCIELHKPDENYKSVTELLNSFPNIEIYLQGSSRPYILYPKNYFYAEYLSEKERKKGLTRLCLALKGEAHGRVILGAFKRINKLKYLKKIVIQKHLRL